MLKKKHIKSTITNKKKRYGSVAEADTLKNDAEIIKVEQEQLLDSASIDLLYETTLDAYVLEKHSQVDRIEGRLEALILRNESKLWHHLKDKPGFMARPSTKRLWEKKRNQIRSTIKLIKQRLYRVSEIKEGMGLFSPKIEELATRKLRAANPELASNWQAMREAKRKLSIDNVESFKLSKGLSLSQSLSYKNNSGGR